MNAGAACVILDARGRVLLIKENYDERRRWSLPGGAIEPDEAPQDAAAREAREETSLEVAVEHLIGIYRLDNGFQVYAFAARIMRGRPSVPSTDEIADVAWHDARALPQPRSNVLHYAVPDALAGARGIVRENLPRVT